MTDDRVRHAGPTDAEGIAQVHVATWHTTYRGLLPNDFIDVNTLERRTRFWQKVLTRDDRLALVVESRGRIVGFALSGATLTPDLGFAGELYALYVLRDQQRRGFGRLLFDASRSGLAAGGFPTMMLWVLADNPAAHFYKHLGGRFLASRIEEFGGARLEELAYGWRGRRRPA